MAQPTRPSEYAAHPVPSIEDFQSLWTTWDIVTKTMIPREDLLSKPIKLRNALVFYLGHIPTFFGVSSCTSLNPPSTFLTISRYPFDSGLARKTYPPQVLPTDFRTWHRPRRRGPRAMPLTQRDPRRVASPRRYTRLPRASPQQSAIYSERQHSAERPMPRRSSLDRLRARGYASRNFPLHAITE